MSELLREIDEILEFRLSDNSVLADAARKAPYPGVEAVVALLRLRESIQLVRELAVAVERKAQPSAEPAGYFHNTTADDDLIQRWEQSEREEGGAVPLYRHAQPSAEPVAMRHLACIEDGELRMMSGYKIPQYDCELYAMPDGKAAPALYTHPPTDSAALRDAGVSEQELIALLPGHYYMDPPDGGSVTVLEQLQRMARDAGRYRHIRELAWYVDAAARVYDIGNQSSPWLTERYSVDADEVESALDATIAEQEAP